MSAVIPFARPAAARPDSWSQQELAEFYRVEAALLRAGIGIASEHGVSDEGEPWFVFCRPDGDAIMHFARIDGSYLIASEVLDRPVRGADFRALIDQIARLHPHLLPIPAIATGTKLVVHPAALLAALVAAAALILSSEDARAGEIEAGLDPLPPGHPSAGGGAGHDQPQPARIKGAAGPDDPDNARKQAEAIILSTMIFAAEALAGDHGDARSDLAHLLSDPASAALHHVVQGDPATGTSGRLDAGPGAAALVQPAVLTAQGSGTSQATASAAGRIDAAPAIRPDSAGDRAGPPGRESEHAAPHSGNEAGLTRVAAETSAVGTGGQQTSAAGHAEGAAQAPAASGADGDPRATASQPSTPDASPHPRLVEAAQDESGSATASQAWVHATGQADAGRPPAASVARVADERGGDRDHGSRVDSAAAAGPRAERADDGHGRGPGQDVQARSDAQGGSDPHGSRDGEPGSLVRTPAPASGDSAQTGGPGKAEHASAEPGDHRGPAARDTGPAESGPGSGTLAGEADKRSGPGPDGLPSHAAVAPAAPDRGPEKAAGDRQPSRGQDSTSGQDSSSRQDAHSGHGPSSGHGPDTPADTGSADAASPSSGPPRGGPDTADASSGPPENAAATMARANHVDANGAAPHPTGGPASRGQAADAADPTSPSLRGDASPGEQDHHGHDTPSNPAASAAAQGGSARPEAPHADQTRPEHGTPSPPGSENAIVHQAAGGPPAPHDGSSAPTEPGRAQAVASDPASDRVDPGARDASLDRAPGAAGPHPTGDGTAVQAATSPSHGPADPVQAGKDHSSDPAGPGGGQPALPRATIDPNGNLVFHGETHPGAPPTASHGPDDAAAHPLIGLVGVPEHGHVVHDPYHHG